MLGAVLFFTGAATLWDTLTTFLGIYGMGMGKASGFSFSVLAFALIGSLVTSGFVVATTQIWSSNVGGVSGMLFRGMWLIAVFLDFTTSWAANAGMMKNTESDIHLIVGGLTLVICAAPMAMGAMLKRMGQL